MKGLLLSKKKKSCLLEHGWMGLMGIILSTISQTVKDKYHEKYLYVEAKKNRAQKYREWAGDFRGRDRKMIKIKIG